MQRKPRFSGILLVAVLMVVVLLFVSLSPLVAASASKHVNYSDIYYYFQNQQVTSYRLDRNTNVLEMWLKEGKMPLPEDTSSTAGSAVWRLADQPQRQPGRWRRTARQRRNRLRQL